MGATESPKKKSAVLLISNETTFVAIKDILEGMGYEVCGSIAAGEHADFAVICSYFVLLGTANQLRAVNPSLPMTLVLDDQYKLNGHMEKKDFYDVIAFDGCYGTEIKRKIGWWFSSGPGKSLVRAMSGN